MKLLLGTLILFSTSIYAQVNYIDNIQPIIVEHCISCHANGKIGPMAFDNYENVAAFASMIEYVTTNDIMPPWRANQNHRELSISKYLSDEEKQVIKAWIEAGLPEGKVNNDVVQVLAQNNLPASCGIKTPPSQTGSVENKSITFEIAEPFLHAGNYSMHQRVFVIPTTFEKDIYINKVEFIPSNEKIVLGCNISIDRTGQGRKYDAMDPRSGYANVTGVAFRPNTLNWYNWSPDDIQKSLDGYRLLPAQSDLLLYIQYAPTAKDQLDQSKVKISYSESPPKGNQILSKVLIDSSSLSRPFFISKNSVQDIRVEYEFKDRVKLYAVMPFGQLVCESWEISLLDPSGVSITLLEIEDWQFKWQRKYKFVDPIEIEKGSKIIAKATYKNTAENIDIPILPTKNIRYGEGLNQELFLVSFDYAKLN